MMQIDGMWTRTCPQCNVEVVHKSKAKCRAAERLGRVCSPCNRRNVGVSNARTDICPVCNAILRLSRTKSGIRHLEEHAASHGLDSASLWLLKQELEYPPTCACGCGAAVTWTGWWSGFSAYVLGHNARVETEETRERRLSALKDSFSSGKNVGWSKGLTKDTDERVKARAAATSIGRAKAFAEERIEIWSKGKTKEDHEGLERLSKTLAEKYANGELTPWSKGKTKETDPRIQNMAARVSVAHRNAELRKRLDGLKRLSLEEIKERVERGGLLSLEYVEGEYENYLQPNVIVRCKSCGTSWSDSVKRLDSCRCFTCDPAGSKAQSEISEWMRGLGRVVTTNDRSKIGGLELDVFDAQAQFAIEYNGHYWHNITKKSSTYHQTKTDRCNEAGIRLLHVFEDEWRDKRSIVESMIMHRLGMTRRKLDARECKLVKLSGDQRKRFFEANHIDGDVKAGIALALVHEAEIVCAISLRAPFHKRYSGFTEVARTCSALNTSVRGGMSRLMKAAKAHAETTDRPSLMTYVDTRFGASTEAWLKTGWRFDSATAVRWWWTDNHDRFNRFKYRADAEKGLTEDQVANAAGVVRIYGCKNQLFTLV